MKPKDETSDFDYVLVGGGLQSGLLALALQHYQPGARVALIERGQQLGGNHTWCFHPGDVPPSCRAWVEPLIQYRWPSYEVRLGTFRRHVGLPYASIPSDHFARIVSAAFSPSASRTVSDWLLLTGTDVIVVNEHDVVTRCGKRIRGRMVVDCRGPGAQGIGFAGCGFQKFRGFEVELEQDWPTKLPVIMEGVVDQSDGFRFIYALPFTARRVLVEDTRFSDTPDCDRQECFDFVREYLRRHGIGRFQVVREESGVLPMPFTSAGPAAFESPLAGGYAGGWFHAATGYSFPLAVAFAEAVASGPLDFVSERVRALSGQHAWRCRYSRFLNRLLFRLVAPRHRHRIFRRFYGVLSEPSIERFYSHLFTVGDALRIVVGLPPTLVGLRPHRFIRSYLSGVAS